MTGALLSAAAGNDPLCVGACFAVGYVVSVWPDAIERDSKHRALRWARPFSPFVKHRGMSHSWELVALWLLAGWWLPPVLDYPFWAVGLGLLSHLTGDWLFGRAGYGRKAGIPMFLGTCHKGLGALKVNGWTEPKLRVLLTWVKWPALAIAVMWSFVHLAVA